MSTAGPVGRTLGHYRILEQIGAGGMGVVYCAYDERLERRVALKLLPPGTLADDSARKRFRTEALALSRLNHPNIATVHDFDTEDGTDFLVTELVPGQTLDERLMAGPLSEKDVLQLGAQLADALDAAHRAGVVHRDLKPGNLRLTPEGRLKVLDFGLAKRAVDSSPDSETQSQFPLTQPGAVLGTLAYMAPEQLRGENVDARADLWAAGVVLYELSTGRRPFAGRTANVVGDEIFHAAAPSPLSLRPELSPRLADIILKCLEKDPDNRYQSAKELLVDLRRLSAPATMVTPPSAVTKPAGTRRQMVAAAILLVIAAALLWMALRTLRNSPAAQTYPTNSAAARVSTGAPASSIPEANEYFEKAMLFLGTQFDLPRAREMLERALSLDPHFAEARAWYGFTGVLMVDSGYSNDSSWFYKAEQEALQALRDDPKLERGHSVLAAAYLMQGRKELVPTEIEKALAANPEAIDARIWLYNYDQLTGNYAAAQSIARQLVDKQPLFFPARMNLGDSLRENGDVPNAILQFQKILEVDPQNSYAITKLASTYLDAGDLVNARRTLERGSPTDRSHYRIRLAWALLLALESKKQEAAKEIDPELTKYCQTSVWSTLPMAEFYAVMGDSTEALAWLERAVSNGDERVEVFRRDPLLANIRNLPRFQQILESTEYRRRQRPPAPTVP